MGKKSWSTLMLWYAGPLCQNTVALGSMTDIFSVSICLEEENHHLETICSGLS